MKGQEKRLEKQFLAAYEAYADAIFRHCYFKTSDRDLAKDLVQQTFLQAWSYAKDDKAVENWRAFLYRIANNLVIDWYRRSKADSLDELTDQGFEPTGHTSDPAIEAEFQHALGILQKLSATDRDLITWRYVEDLSPKEIALILEETENNVSVKLHRALGKLRDLLT